MKSTKKLLVCAIVATSSLMVVQGSSAAEDLSVNLESKFDLVDAACSTTVPAQCEDPKYPITLPRIFSEVYLASKAFYVSLSH